MKRQHITKVLPFVTLLAPTAFANTNTFDLAFNNKMLSAELGTFFENSDLNVTATFDKHINTGHIITLSGFKSHEIDIHRLGFGLQSVNAWFKDNDQSNSYTFAVYGSYRLEVVHGLYVHTQAAYAPEIFTMNSELENYTMFSSQLEYELMPDVELFSGYRYVNFNFYQDAHLTFDENVYLGARFVF